MILNVTRMRHLNIFPEQADTVGIVLANFTTQMKLTHSGHISPTPLSRRNTTLITSLENTSAYVHISPASGKV